MKRIVSAILLFIVMFATSTSSVHAGALAGVATEWTQIMNNIQLVQHTANQLQQIQNQLQQYETMLQQTQSLTSGNANQIFGNIVQDMNQLSSIVQNGQGLAYSMANLDSEFQNRYGGFGYSTPQNLPGQYKNWAQTSLDTVKGVLKGVGVQSSQLNSDAAMVKQLQQMSQNSTTMLQAVQAGNQIAAQQALELEKLRQLIMMDLTSKQTFQAEQTQKAMSNQDLQDHFFADPDNGQYDRTTY